MNARERAEHALRLLPFTPEAKEQFIESVAIEIEKAEREVVGRPKIIEKVVEDTILLLKALTRGEGIASIEVFDVGVGGGFENGKLHIERLRDGKSIDRTIRDGPQSLKRLILDALFLGDYSCPGTVLCDVTWIEYVAESEA